MHYVLNHVVCMNCIRLSFMMESDSPSLHNVIKAATVECMKCPKFHTSFFSVKCIIRVYKVHFFSKYPDLRPWPLESACSWEAPNWEPVQVIHWKEPVQTNDSLTIRTYSQFASGERERGGGQAALIYRHNHTCITDRTSRNTDVCSSRRAAVTSCL